MFSARFQALGKTVVIRAYSAFALAHTNRPARIVRLCGSAGLIHRLYLRKQTVGRTQSIYISQRDYEYLSRLLGESLTEQSKDRDFAEALRREMERARVVPPERMRSDVVTVNSRVLLEDLATHEVFAVEVVLPQDADADAHKISVLAPVGTALLGYRVGSTVQWPVPGGVRKLKIREMLYQPEANGNFEL